MSKHLRILFTALSVVVALHTAMAQKKPPVEVTAKCLSDNYYMQPIGENGVIVFAENLEKQDARNHYWSITRYDKDFKEVYNKELKVNFVVDLDKYFLSTDGHQLHMLFTEHTIAAYNSYVSEGYYQVFTLNTDSGTFKMRDGKMEFKFAIEGFAVLGNRVFIGGKTVPAQSDINSLKALAYIGLGIPFLFNITYIPSTPILVNVDLESGAAVLIDLKFDGSAEVSNISINPTTQFADVSIDEFNTAQESKVYINSFDGAGNLRGTQVLKGKNGNLLASATQQTLQNGDKYMMGTFAIDPDKSKSKGSESKDNNADGFYLAKMGEVKPAYIQFFNFSKIKNFLKSVQGNELNYNVNFHQIIELKNGQLVLVGELYSSEYIYDEKIITDDKNNLKRITVPLFDKYLFTQVFACGLDKNTGKMLWNEAFYIDPTMSTTSLSAKVLLTMKNDKVAITYPQKNALHYKVLNSKELNDNRDLGPIPVPNFGEIQAENNRCDMQSWYANYIYTSGFQLVKASKATTKPPKPVFNFSKIAMQ